MIMKRIYGLEFTKAKFTRKLFVWIRMNICNDLLDLKYFPQSLHMASAIWNSFTLLRLCDREIDDWQVCFWIWTLFHKVDNQIHVSRSHGYHEYELSNIFHSWICFRRDGKQSLQQKSLIVFVIFALVVTQASGALEYFVTKCASMAISWYLTVVIVYVNSQVCFILQNFVTIGTSNASFNFISWKYRSILYWNFDGFFLW